MTVTSVRIRLVDWNDDHLLAFVAITLDEALCMRDLKIIDGGPNKPPFVSFPNRKQTDRCRRCRKTNAVSAVYCNECGDKLPDNQIQQRRDGRPKLYTSIVFPVSQTVRDAFETAIIDEYRRELERAKRPDYVCAYEYDDHE